MSRSFANRRSRVALTLVCGCCVTAFAAVATAGDAAVVIGNQPLAVPAGVVVAVMKRDRELARVLGKRMQVRDFAKGGDIVPGLVSGSLQAAVLGDMPAVSAAIQGDVRVVALAKHSFSSIVARGLVSVSDLRGKRIGYGPASTAHHVLLQALASEGLRESDVRLVDLRLHEMPDALEQGRIDAFVGWEPAPTIALTRSARNVAVYRGLSLSFLVLNADFARRNPAEAGELVAGFVRAVHWMQSDFRNLDQAAAWMVADATMYANGETGMTRAMVADLTRRELLEVPSTPRVPRNLASPRGGLLFRQFHFLKELGKLSPSADWARVRASIDETMLAGILAAPERNRLGRFDYRQQGG